MDINCTNECMYQSEGKCMLTELSAARGRYAPGSGVQEACPYFMDKRGDQADILF